MLSFKKILNWGWPVGFIFIVWLLFSYPYFLRGLVPFPSDYLVNFFAPWNAYPGFLSPIKNNATPDVITQIYPWKNLVMEIWRAGSIPLWNPYSFSGTPLLANYQSAVLSPLNFLYLVLPFIDAWSIQILLAPLLAGLFTYLFSRSLKIGKFGSILSSVAFMFSGFITTWMVYGTLPYAILFLPLALFSIEKFYETKKWYYSIILTLSIPLSFFSGHFQISIYFLLFVVCYSLFKFMGKKDLKSFVLSLVSIFFGLLISAPQVIPSIEFYSLAVRSSIFQKIEVIPWGYLSTFIAPDFLGNPVTRNDWFGHYAEWNAYIGFIPLMLGFYSIRKLNRTVIFLLISSIIVLLLAFQTPLLDLLVALKIPVLSTSAASRIIVLFSFSFSILAGFGFENLISDFKNKEFGKILSLFISFGMILALLWAIVLFKLFMPIDKILIAKSNLKLPTFIFTITLASVVFSSFVKNKKILVLLSVVLIVISALDMLRFTTKWMPFEPASLVYPEVGVSRYLSSIAGYDRVYGNFGAEVSTTLRIPSVDGYDPLYSSRYGELVNYASEGTLRIPDRSGVALAKNGKYTSKLINLLGIKYFVNKIADGRMPWAFPIWKYPLDQFKIVYHDDAYQVFENQQVFPQAYLVSSYKIVLDKHKLLSEMFSDKTDLKTTAILEQNTGINISGATGSAIIKSYEPNKIQIQTNSTGSALLVLTDSYYPGWKADVDGSSTKIYRADYAFRGVPISAGTHTITFAYDPDSFKIGMWLFVLGSLGLFVMLGYNFKRK